MKILIVGGGIGGLSLATFLEKEGFDYKLIEREQNWAKHGYSLGMWSNGRTMLSKLGLSDKFDANMVSYQKLCVKTFWGRTLKRYDLKSFVINYGLGYSHIRRQDLHDWLLSGVDNSKIQMQTTVTSLIEDQNGVQVTYNNGDSETFDLVVGADGVHSSIRKICFGNNLEHYINWRCWYANPQTKISEPHTVTEYLEPGRFLNIFDESGKNLAIFGSSMNHTNFDETTGRIDRLKLLFKDNSLTLQVLDGLRDEDVLPTDLAEVKLKKWTTDRVALLGDAAHSFEPFAGLGGSMAMEDAYVLSAELLKVSDNYTLTNALNSYEQKRYQRVEEARYLTWKMKAWATIKSSILYRLVNLFAPIVPTKYFTKGFIDLMNREI